ncbi:hypothetical protein ABBQ32_001937 [Trebouxia sp. C0010 RCD-2024]
MAVTTAVPKLDSTTIQPPPLSQALLKMKDRVSLPAYGPAVRVETEFPAVSAWADSALCALTHQNPQQSAQGDIKYCLYAGYLGNDVNRIVVSSTIKHYRSTMSQSLPWRAS